VSEAMSQEELEQRINKMSDEEQAHFKLLIYKLVMCYGEGQAQGVVIIGRAEDNFAGVVTLNCDEMDPRRNLIETNSMVRPTQRLLLGKANKDNCTRNC